MHSCSMLPAHRAAVLLRICATSPGVDQRLLHAQVVFPLVLDLYEFCTEDYKKALEGPRKAWQEAEDKKAGLERAAKAAAKSATKDEKAPEVSCLEPKCTTYIYLNLSLHLVSHLRPRESVCCQNTLCQACV